jgi:accessory gene regulator protein AgrB
MAIYFGCMDPDFFFLLPSETLKVMNSNFFLCPFDFGNHKYNTIMCTCTSKLCWSSHLFLTWCPCISVEAMQLLDYTGLFWCQYIGFV